MQTNDLAAKGSGWERLFCWRRPSRRLPPWASSASSQARQSAWIKSTAVQVCTLHYHTRREFQLSGHQFYSPLRYGLQCFRRRGVQKSPSAVVAGAMPWEGVLRVCLPGFWKLSERLQCPLLLWPVAGREVTEPAPIRAVSAESDIQFAIFYAKSVYGQVLLHLWRTGLGGKICCQWLCLSRGWSRFPPIGMFLHFCSVMLC